MFTDPRALIAQTIANLESVHEMLSGDIVERRQDASTLRSKETRLSISVLLPKLRALRSDEAQALRAPRVCINCDD